MEEYSQREDNPITTSCMREFQMLANYCSITDLASYGPLYTWCNNRENGLIMKKLNRVMVNDLWNHAFPQSYNVFKAGGCSDHLRCRINLNGQAGGVAGAKKSFMFVNTIADVENFKPMVAITGRKQSLFVYLPPPCTGFLRN